MSKAFFIAGTDTEIGKTTISCALLQAALGSVLSTLGLKPVASRCRLFGGQLRNQDALSLQALSTIDLPYEVINPYAFAPAIAPHVAAAQQGIKIELAVVQHAFYKAQYSQPDVLLVEGAGGWLTPISAQHSMADVALCLQLPVILVVGMRLGCINHALLTAQAIAASGLPLAGWVANHLEQDMQPAASYLQQKISAPCLAQVPYLATVKVQQLAMHCAGWWQQLE